MLFFIVVCFSIQFLKILCYTFLHVFTIITKKNLIHLLTAWVWGLCLFCWTRESWNRQKKRLWPFKTKLNLVLCIDILCMMRFLWGSWRRIHHQLINWLIGWRFTPYRQYFSHVSAAITGWSTNRLICTQFGFNDRKFMKNYDYCREQSRQG